MSEPLKVALVGTGRIARAHLRAYQKYPEQVKLTAICDVRPEALKQFSEISGVTRGYTDYQELLNQADIDALDICTGHDQHEYQLTTAAQAGKHVLLEKAMARSLEEGRRMVQAAQKNGITFMVGQDLRFLPESLAIKKMIERDELGTIRITRCASIRNESFGFPPGDWLLDGQKAGGGVVLSVTSHQIDLLRYFIGEVKSVSAISRTVHPEYINGVEEYICANLEFENGAIGDIIGVFSPIRSPLGLQYMILGDRGSLYSTPPEPEHQIHQFGSPMVASSQREGGVIEKFGRFTSLDPVFEGLVEADPFVNEILHFADCCRSGKEPLTNGRDNLNTLKVVFGIYAAARTGNRVALSSL